jgi:hypothetical protein
VARTSLISADFTSLRLLHFRKELRQLARCRARACSRLSVANSREALTTSSI